MYKFNHQKWLPSYYSFKLKDKLLCIFIYFLLITRNANKNQDEFINNVLFNKVATVSFVENERKKFTQQTDLSTIDNKRQKKFD